MTANRILGRIGLCLLAGSPAILHAQGTQTANVAGEVLSRNGQPVAHATVRLISPAMQWPRLCMTNAEGRFVARMLPPGVYQIEVSASGFQTNSIKQVVGVGQTFAPKIILVEEVGATVEVVASDPAAERTETRTASNYELAKIDPLPTGRSMEALALLTPGITAGVGGRTQIRGAMTSESLYLMDGQNISDNIYNNRGVRLIDDFIEQVEIIRGALPAEYGNVEGGVLNAVTISGGNTFTGQVRWALSNAAWNAMAPLQSRTSVVDTVNSALSATLGGYIVKDRLWFAAAAYTTSVDAPSAITPTAANSAGLPTAYTASTDETRTHVKLTWSPTANHTIVGAYNAATIDDKNRSYNAGELAALAPQRSTATFWNLTWRALWTPAIGMEIKYGQKTQSLTVRTDASKGSPIRDGNLFRSYYFQNAPFAPDSEDRNNRTFDAKLSLLWEGLGQHTTELGLQGYQGIVKDPGVPSPTGVQLWVTNVDLGARTAVPDVRSTYVAVPGEAKNESLGLFLSDQWVVSDRLSLTLGARQDYYRGYNESGDETFSTQAWSPRISLKLDPTGTRVWAAGLSWARYNGRPLETIMNKVTHQGNPIRYDAPALSGSALPFSQLDNPSLYGAPVASDATLGVQLDPGLRPPRVDEWQASLSYSFHGASTEGFVRLTGVQKSWADLLDRRVGNDGTYTTGGSTGFLTVWYNSPLAVRTYKGLELDAQAKRGPWNLEGNVTWSRLQGNYEGEATNTPGRGEGLAYYTIINGVFIYDSALTNPEGYLQGHVPLRSRVMASYTKTSSLGVSTVGLVFRFDGPATFDQVRNVPMSAISPVFPNTLTTTQYLDGRGTGRFHAARYFDLALSQDLPMFRVLATPVRAYVKATITNVFNHQQWLRWDTAYAPASSTTTDPWVPNSPATFGKPTSFSDYGTPRSLSFTAGIRF